MRIYKHYPSTSLKNWLSSLERRAPNVLQFSSPSALRINSDGHEDYAIFSILIITQEYIWRLMFVILTFPIATIQVARSLKPLTGRLSRSGLYVTFSSDIYTFFLNLLRISPVAFSESGYYKWYICLYITFCLIVVNTDGATRSLSPMPSLILVKIYIVYFAHITLTVLDIFFCLDKIPAAL